MMNSAPDLMPPGQREVTVLVFVQKRIEFRPKLVQVAEAGLFPAAEGVIGERHRDRHVDAHHARIYAGGEIASRVAIAGEDRGAVAVFVIARERQGLFVIERMEYMSMPGPAEPLNSPFMRCGMPVANSTISSPRWMPAMLSASVLPCSDDSSAASGVAGLRVVAAAPRSGPTGTG